jgi:hypothetical protein
LDTIRKHLFSPASRGGGVVVTTPERLLYGRGLDLLVIGDNKVRAHAELQTVIGLLETD